ncbi:MAG TPA: hypothetical protein VKU37_03055, partial [Verrucomicrobiae bacterium]|nr:hypothetical protein [Verrucomicrobiae bacterium]
LMTVFNSTQKAFRSGLTQTDVLESGRLAMGLITSDLEGMTPSLSPSNAIYFNNVSNNVNFYAAVTSFASPPSPLYQSLIGASSPGTQRTNVLESFYSLSRQNINGSLNWVGTGYVVMTNSQDGALYPLYRFYLTTNVAAGSASLYNQFNNQLVSGAWTNWSHLMDGVVSLTVRPYDPNGFRMTNTYPFYTGSIGSTNNNVYFLPFGFGSDFGETGFYMFCNTVPASVEVELGVLEDAVLQRAEGLTTNSQTTYLSDHAGQVHLFRQRVLIRNVDPTAYQ